MISKQIHSTNAPAYRNRGQAVPANQNLFGRASQKKSPKLKILAISFILVALTAFIGSLFTTPSISSGWYEQIKPAISPPNFVFPIAWGILYLLLAVSLYFAYVGAKENEKRNIFLAYGANLILNALWSFAFFGLQNPLLGMIVLVLLWVSILGAMFVALKIDQKAGLMLIPYLAWVSFAGLLNYLVFSKAG